MSHPSPQTPDPRDPQGQPHQPQYTGYGYGGQPLDPRTGQPYPPYGYQQQAPQKSNGLAIGSLIVGVVALALAWIPIVNYAAMVLGIIGLVLGGIGIFQSHRMMSIAGATLSLVAIIVSFAVFASFANSLNQAAEDYNTASGAAPTLTDPDLGYEGEGYPTGGAEGLEQEADAGLPETNGRGNIVKAIGEEAGITNFDGTEDVVTWTVNDVETNISCTEPYQSSEPEGHLTTVDLSLSTSAGFDELTGGYASLSGYNWEFIDSEGVTHNELETIATYSCLSDSATFHYGSLGSDQNYEGKVVLDLPDTSGTLVFTPNFDAYSDSGWEYPVG